MSYLTRLNTLLTTTTTTYSSLRRNLLPNTATSEADDVSLTDPNSSHVSRVLRAYYAEKQLPYPDWLGPDPKDAARLQRERERGERVVAASQSQQQQRPVGSLRSNASSGSAGGGGGLGDIWGGDGANITTNTNNNQERTSLRRGPGIGRRPPLPTSASTSGNLNGDSSQHLNVRPLPSQRAGSYQTQGSSSAASALGRSGSPVPPGSSGSMSAGGGGGGAAERLKARLNRGGSGRSVEGAPSRFEERRDGSGGGGSGGGGQGSYATQGLSGWQGRR